MFLRVTNPNAVEVPLYDIGVVIAASATNVVLSSQFNVQDLVRSADLETAIINGDLTVQLDYGTGWQSVAAADYTNRDALATFANVYEITNENNNEDLVDGSDVNASGPSSTPLHIHDARYFTESELTDHTATSGATNIGYDDAGNTYVTGTTVQAALDNIESQLGSFDLDDVYTNDVDGILNVNGTTKPLEFRSNNVNDILVTRKLLTDIQNAILFDVSANNLELGSLAVGALAQVDVHVKSDLYVDGDIQFTGTITDQTVNNMNVTNEKITLRDGATVGADAYLAVERGSTGADAQLKWNETTDRWMAGLATTEETIALLEHNEVVSGVWNFKPDTTEPNFWLQERTATPSTALGAAGEVPVAMMGSGVLATYDKSNSRNKFLSVDRLIVGFTGRANATNKNEYMYYGLVNTFATAFPLPYACTLVRAQAILDDVGTVNMRVRKNDAATNVATLALSGVKKAVDDTLNVDFAAGDEIQPYIDTAAGAGVGSPVFVLEFARKY